MILFGVAVGAEERDAADLRRLRYGVSVHNPDAAPVQNAEVIVEVPVSLSSQRVVDMRVSHPFEVVADGAHNSMLRLRMDMPPHGRKTIRIEAVVRVSPRPLPDPAIDPEASLGATRYHEVTDSRIRAAASEVGGSAALDVARRLFDFVATHVVMEGYVAEDRGALWALVSGVGDCTESMDLFIALARARGIPARGLEGYVVADDAVLRPEKLHNWAEFYANGAWHLADPQRRAFADGAESYVAMRVLDDAAPTRRRRLAVTPASLNARLE